MIDDADLSAIVIEGALPPGLDAHGCRLVRLDADADAIAREPAQQPADLGVPDHVAYVIYTSRSTGRPRA